MPENSQDWLVMHRVVFKEKINGNGKPFPGPDGADAWRFYPASPTGPDGMRTNISREWGGIGIYTSRDAAEAVYASPAEHLTFLDQTTEQWHALLVPYAHRGRVNWRGGVRDETSFTTAATDPGGPLLVLTSAGYENPGPGDVKRIKNFLEQVDNVVDFYASLPSNIRRAVYSGVGVEQIDGMTVSLWENDAAMMQAAYRPGLHKEQMDFHRNYDHFDRSSFTRTRILESKGTWDGSDPVAQMS